MRWKPIHGVVAAVAVLAAVAIPAVQYRQHWMKWLAAGTTGEPGGEQSHSPVAGADQVVLSRNAQLNLQPDAQPLIAEETHWRYVRLPGTVVDRPGFSDRGVVAPATGVVTKIHRLPGDAVRPGDPLFTLRLFSESLQVTQSELFKTARDVQLAQEQRRRLTDPSVRDAVAGSRLIEIDSQLRRLEAAIRASRQELQNRGLTSEQIDRAAEGQFVSEVRINVPAIAADPPHGGGTQGSEPRSGELVTDPVAPSVAGKALTGTPGSAPREGKQATTVQPLSATPPATFEIQELKVELGQQVQAGQTLCLLADHNFLYIEGRGFRQEIPLVELAAREAWPVQVEFLEATDSGRPPLELRIRHLSNSIDTASRTFAFYLPLENESHLYEKDGRELRTWRFRPGQRVRLGLRAEKFTNVFVLPADAVVREGPEAYVFQQKGEAFLRKSVHVLDQDRDHVVIARDDSLPLGIKVARHGALQINRVLKSKGGELPPGYHMHPDGTVHGPH
jgi:cobalt-zinc-cadmium efflux system membrane fusion protein